MCSWELIRKVRKREIAQDLAPVILIIQKGIKVVNRNVLADVRVHHEAHQVPVETATDIDHSAEAQTEDERKKQEKGYCCFRFPSGAVVTI